ncbi:fluoride efflux transporter CrcB [Barrientosiimonas marina]|uniref:Fluoride-specific ion channel n=1 Tax=Lentibacillus kimchii TaxID=1542911 RepID=A0ABW2US26_9BACI
MIYVLIGIAGMIGALLRYGLSLIFGFSGDTILGLLVGTDIKTSWHLLFGTGFMGAFTTFSTFKIETIKPLLPKQKENAYNLPGYKLYRRYFISVSRINHWHALKKFLPRS